MNIFGRLNNEVLRDDIKKCKKKKTCKDLTCRAFYFEPNKHTIKKWREEKKALTCVFFLYARVLVQVVYRNDDDIDVKRCWGKENAKQSSIPFRNLERFLEIRKVNRLENCYITNVLKCGPRKGFHHSKEEIENCSGRLKEEIKIIHPEVVVAVGGEVADYAYILQKYYKKFLEDQDFKKPYKIAHYAFHGSNEKLWEDYWDKEFKELKKIISRSPKYIPIK